MKANVGAQCEGKEKFESMRRARGVANRRRRSRKDLGGHAYHCSVCRGYHIGTLVGGRYRNGRPKDRRQFDEVEL